jgi:hypothetical protein
MFTFRFRFRSGHVFMFMLLIGTKMTIYFPDCATESREAAKILGVQLAK